MKKQIAQMPRGVARDMGPGNIPRRSGGLFRGLPMAKPIMGDMRFRGSMPSIIEGRAERLPTAPSGIAGLMNRLPQKNTAFSEAVRKLKEQIRNQQMPQPMPGAMPQVDMQNIPQIPTRESIQDYVRENIDFSNLQSRMPNFQMFQEGGFVGTMGGPGYGEYPLGTAGPRVDPSDPNYVPPGSAGRTPGFYVGGFEGPLLGPKTDAGAMPPENNFFVDGDGNLNVGDGIIRPMGMPPAPTPASSFMPEGMSDRFAEQLADKGVDLTDPSSYMYMDLRGGAGGGSRGIGEKLMMMPKITGINPDYVPTPEPTPEPIYTPPPMVPNIPKIPNIDLSNLPKFNSQTTSGRPMIPNFGNINLR